MSAGRKKSIVNWLPERDVYLEFYDQLPNTWKKKIPREGIFEIVRAIEWQYYCMLSLATMKFPCAKIIGLAFMKRITSRPDDIKKEKAKFKKLLKEDYKPNLAEGDHYYQKKVRNAKKKNLLSYEDIIEMTKPKEDEI